MHQPLLAHWEVPFERIRGGSLDLRLQEQVVTDLSTLLVRNLPAAYRLSQAAQAQGHRWSQRLTPSAQSIVCYAKPDFRPVWAGALNALRSKFFCADTYYTFTRIYPVAHAQRPAHIKYQAVHGWIASVSSTVCVH